MAESLLHVDDPLATVLQAGPPASPAPVARAIARSLAPPEFAGPAPEWLRADQVASFRRCRAALERHGGALLADPVGSGKTWIALAVAWSLGQPAAGVVPAALLPQWHATARRLGIALELVSQEAVSRGRLPDSSAALVMLDECHRFRNPATRRYTSLARWLIGRRVLFLSATPVVNRLEDLAHQLLLAVPDDALRARGLDSILESLRAGAAHPALGEVVLSRPRPLDTPARSGRDLSPDPDPEEAALAAELGRLRLSRDPGIRALIRVVLWRALASSPAALAGALDRYLALLDQAGAAACSGRRVSRAAIRAWCGAEAGQYLLWEVLPDGGAGTDLHTGDRRRVTGLLARAREYALRGDTRSRAVAAILDDRRITLVFTGSRDTLDYLRGQWRHLRPAWVTGSAAGIGSTRLSRSSVLAWFSQPRPPLPTPLQSPCLLLATDVAAEGLDLQQAVRVVHYDLPWTSVRMDQREGRARRLGSGVRDVEVLRCLPSPGLERLLRTQDRLTHKRELSFVAGLGDEARWLYRWRADLAAWSAGDAVAGVAVAEGDDDGWLVGVAFDSLRPEGGVRQQPAELWWIGHDGSFDTTAPRLVPRLLALAGARPSGGDPALAALWPALCGQVRRRLREAAARSLTPTVAPPRRAVLRKLRRLAAQAGRRRDRETLVRLDRLMERLAAGLTAGETQVLAAAAEAHAHLPHALTPLLTGSRSPRAHLVPRLTGIVRVTSFDPCPDSARSCSISMAPSLIPSA